MDQFGVSDMAIYIPPFYLAHEDLAKARGVPAEKYLRGLGNSKMSILPNWEDSVTMAANAAIQILDKTGIDPKVIEQEKSIYADQVKDKPANIVEKVIRKGHDGCREWCEHYERIAQGHPLHRAGRCLPMIRL